MSEEWLLSDGEIEQLKAKAEQQIWQHKSHPRFEREKVLLEAQAAKSFEAGKALSSAAFEVGKLEGKLEGKRELMKCLNGHRMIRREHSKDYSSYVCYECGEVRKRFGNEVIHFDHIPWVLQEAREKGILPAC